MLVPGASPGAGSDKTTHTVLARNQRGKTASVAQAHHKNAIQVDEIVLAHGVESGLVTFELSLKVGFTAWSPLAFTDARLIHANRGITGLVIKRRSMAPKPSVSP